MPVRTLGPKGGDPHRLEEGKSASEDAGPEGGGLGCPTLVEEENKL